MTLYLRKVGEGSALLFQKAHACMAAGRHTMSNLCWKPWAMAKGPTRVHWERPSRINVPGVVNGRDCGRLLKVGNQSSKSQGLVGKNWTNPSIRRSGKVPKSALSHLPGQATKSNTTEIPMVIRSGKQFPGRRRTLLAWGLAIPWKSPCGYLLPVDGWLEMPSTIKQYFNTYTGPWVVGLRILPATSFLDKY